jgi:alanyl-tRNA synthetase
MEYNRTKEGYQKLKALSVDTGLGLERLSMVIQGKQTIYQTDAFRYLLGYCQALTNAEFYKDTYDGNMADKSYRIFADHIRAVIIALFDGVEFGSYEREFVLRKIFRRLLTHLYLYLNNGLIEQVFTKPIVKAMISDVLCYFGKKKHDADVIWTKLINEEKLFIGKLVHMELFVNNALKKNNNKEEVFKDLHDSKGLPMELLQNIDKVRFL